MSIASLAPLAVVLPFLGAALAFVLIRQPRIQRRVSLGTLAVTLALEVLVLAFVWQSGPVAVHLGGWAPPFGIVMVADQFSSLLLVISSAVSLAVLAYASGQGAADGEEGGPLSVFHPTYLILVAGVSNAFLAGDLFNLYVGFEILLTASYVLMTLGPAAIACAFVDRLYGPARTILATFGRAPLAFYVAHLYLIHVIAVLLGITQGFAAEQFLTRFRYFPPGYGVDLPGVYLIWIAVVVIVYPLCRWVAAVKARRRDWWLSYV